MSILLSFQKIFYQTTKKVVFDIEICYNDTAVYGKAIFHNKTKVMLDMLCWNIARETGERGEKNETRHSSRI